MHRDKRISLPGALICALGRFRERISLMLFSALNLSLFSREETERFDPSLGCCFPKSVRDFCHSLDA